MAFLLLSVICSVMGVTVNGEPSLVLGPMIISGFFAVMTMVGEVAICLLILTIRTVVKKFRNSNTEAENRDLQ